MYIWWNYKRELWLSCWAFVKLRRKNTRFLYLSFNYWKQTTYYIMRYIELAIMEWTLIFSVIFIVIKTGSTSVYIITKAHISALRLGAHQPIMLPKHTYQLMTIDHKSLMRPKFTWRFRTDNQISFLKTNSQWSGELCK